MAKVESRIVKNFGFGRILWPSVDHWVPEGEASDPHDLIFPPWKKTFYSWLHFLVGGGNLFFS